MGPAVRPKDSWHIVDGALYGNYDVDIAKQWLSDVKNNIAKGNKRWVDWYGKLQAGPVNDNCYSFDDGSAHCDRYHAFQNGTWSKDYSFQNESLIH